MSKMDIIRAWKDKEYRNSLSQEEQAQLPANPSGEIELNPSELAQVNGAGTYAMLTAGCCSPTWYYSFVSSGNCTVGGCEWND